MFCPFRSTATEEVECSDDCALFKDFGEDSEKSQCAILSVSESLDSISTDVFKNTNL